MLPICYPKGRVRFPALALPASMCYITGVIEKDMRTPVQTKIRRSHLGIRYDLYVNGCYRATAYTASEIEPLIQSLKLDCE
jgi:hypothetical protein